MDLAIVVIPILVLWVVTSFALHEYLPSLRLAIPKSESVNGKLFLMQDKNISNDYIIFEYTKADYKNYKKGVLFIKKVGCNSGQYLVVANKQAICDGKLIANMFEVNSEGEKLPSYEYSDYIPSDKLFVLGEHPRSFDSRYFGLIDKKSIKYSARKIF